ncbi:MAG: tRNA pseudouridine(55) synthase TruB [Coriobacteriia bacterium]|nr:tRNA pseudouridine(55) synthase TruB [Coriobacteriia bacterium]
MPKYRRGATDFDGVLLIDKPVGMTSHDVVDFVRSVTKEGRVGHTGTLDPGASGLMVVCIGPATKLSAQLTDQKKQYLAEIAFGMSTSTDDAYGEALEITAPPAKIADAAYGKAVLEQFTGTLMQRPPQYSAIKQQGVKAYQKARMGLTVELPPREVTVYQIDLLSVSPTAWDISLEVSKGTYIRALARDIGVFVGCPAHLANLRRTSIGDWRIEDALTLEQLLGYSDPVDLKTCLFDAKGGGNG